MPDSDVDDTSTGESRPLSTSVATEVQLKLLGSGGEGTEVEDASRNLSAKKLNK